MSLAIVVMNNEEEFLQFLDPLLCSLVENHEKGGLRTLEFEYKFQDLHEDKQLFRIGNKIWVSGDTNLSDCLYVINTPVETDVYHENSFKCELEEVLVELNYAPIISQIDITAANGFDLTIENNQRNVKIDWNALNFWFGEYFNIGIVQKCLNEEYNKLVVSGTMTPMSLLRYIEEETENIFVTRYEKDPITNVIHRYLDFLNPINVTADWILNIEYDFTEGVEGEGVFDSSGNESIDEDEHVDTETLDDLVSFDIDYPVMGNVNPSYCQFRITDKNYNLLNVDGNIYIEDNDEIPLLWTSANIGFTSQANHIVICLSSVRNVINLICNNKSFVVNSTEQLGVSNGTGYISTNNAPYSLGEAGIPDDAYFTIYDTQNEQTIFATCLNREIGHVHEEILDFGFNLENVTFETDESDTYTAIAPIISLENHEDFTRENMETLLGYWRDLEISKGEQIPMILEKIQVAPPSSPYTLAHARESMGERSYSNYYSRPYHPQDNIDTSTPSNSTWEFWRATAYWKAPFTKHAGELHVSVENVGGTEYSHIHSRPDLRESRDIIRPKMGTVETSDETVFAIYNDVAMKLKDKMYPEFHITLDVANLRRGQFNPYNLHDKVYVKLPDYQELVTARVSKTSKEAHDVAKNTIELSNYSNNNIKNVLKSTYIDANNVSFKYPQTKDLTVRLVNSDYNSQDSYSVQYVANKLLTFTVYKVEDGNSTLTRTSYTKITDANGLATITMNYDPGDYQFVITFGGDEEYEETSISVDVNVSGVKDAAVNTSKVKPSNLTKSKTTNKTSKSKKVKKYYDKYGVSPDGKYIVAVGRSSASGELAKYGYTFYKTVFYRKCPMCGSKELFYSIFWAGNEHANWGIFPATGKREAGSAEGHIFCKKCDADFSVFGNNHNIENKNLKVYKKAVKSKKSEAYSIKKGKLVYTVETVSNSSKRVTSNKNRTTKYTIPSAVKKQALSIVGDSTGLDAAKKIAKWCGSKKNLKYVDYANFHRKPTTALKKHCANCCDSTRLMLAMMDAAGCTEKLKLEYVHVHNSARNVGHVFAKITTKSTGKYRYVDPCCKIENGRSPWANHLKGWGSIVGTPAYTGPNNSPF